MSSAEHNSMVVHADPTQLRCLRVRLLVGSLAGILERDLHWPPGEWTTAVIDDHTTTIDCVKLTLDPLEMLFLCKTRGFMQKQFCR